MHCNPHIVILTFIKKQMGCNAQSTPFQFEVPVMHYFRKNAIND